MATKKELLILLAKSRSVMDDNVKTSLTDEIDCILQDNGLISERRARLLLHAQRKGKHKNQIFRVEFVKRTTGELRVMRCRYNVKKHLKGGKLGYDPKEKDLSIVFDVDKEEYRAINLNELKNLHINGRSYIVY